MCCQIAPAPIAAGGVMARRPEYRRAIDDQDGVCGVTRSTMPASGGVRSPFAWLQAAQVATVLVQVFRPPRERGRMWSTVAAGPEQWPHCRLSRARTPPLVQAGPIVYRQRVTT